MKRLKYIVIACLLGVFSCQKEDIKPNRSRQCGEDTFDESNRTELFVQSSSDKNEWIKDRIKAGLDKDGLDDDENSGTISSGTTTTGETDTGGGITDPNNEPDASKRKGKK